MRLFRKKNACSIALIRGSHGPTAVTRTKQSPEQREFSKYIAKIQSSATPNRRPFSSLPEYLAERYRAVPYPLSENETAALKINVLLNAFPEQIGAPKLPDGNASRKELIQYVEESERARERAQACPAGRLGLCFQAFLLPGQGEDGSDAVVQFELRSEHLAIKNGSQKLADDLTLWLGVSQQDIDTLSPRFQAYAQALKESESQTAQKNRSL